MECLICHQSGAKFQGQNKKSKIPNIATAYYYCPHYHARFSIDKTEGEIITPQDPDLILRRVFTDIASLPKEKLKVISASVAELL